MATSTRLFKGRVVEDSDRKKGSLTYHPVVSSAILVSASMDEYKSAVIGINLTKFAPAEIDQFVESLTSR